MGYNNEHARLVKSSTVRFPYHAVLDCETLSDDSALPLLGPVEADKRLTDPAKIEADIDKKVAAQRAQMSLDPFAGRICVIAYQTEAQQEPTVLACPTDADERTALLHLADVIRGWDTATQRQVIGYNVLGFDWPFLVTRARLLGVEFPTLDTRKYGNRDICDLYAALTFDGNMPQGAIRRGLKTMARRFGLPVADDTNGSDVAALAAAGDYASISAHCSSDVALTYALAVRLGVIPAAKPHLTALEA